MKASPKIFADDNTLTSFASTLEGLFPIFESGCEAATN